MLKHSKTALATSLTVMEDPEGQRAKKAGFLFKSLLMCMGEKKTSTPDLTAFEIVSCGYEDPHMRAEIYCQLIKQLTENPESESKHRGWAIFGLCLLTFPPPPDFENFVLMFIRSLSLYLSLSIFYLLTRLLNHSLSLTYLLTHSLILSHSLSLSLSHIYI